MLAGAVVLVLGLLPACSRNSGQPPLGPALQLPAIVATVAPLQLVLIEQASFLAFQVRCTRVGTFTAVRVEFHATAASGRPSLTPRDTSGCTTVGETVLAGDITPWGTLHPGEPIMIGLEATETGAVTHVVRVYYVGSDGKLHGQAGVRP
jgi:hypothetical protein